MGHFSPLKGRKSSRILQQLPLVLQLLQLFRQWEASRVLMTLRHLHTLRQRSSNRDGTKHPVKSAVFQPVSAAAEGNHITVASILMSHSSTADVTILLKEEMFGLKPMNRAGTCLGWSFLKVLFESTCGSAERWVWWMDPWGLFKPTVDQAAYSEEEVRNDLAHCHQSRSQGSDLWCFLFHYQLFLQGYCSYNADLLHTVTVSASEVVPGKMSHWLDVNMFGWSSSWIWLLILLPAAPRVEMVNIIIPSMQRNTSLHRNWMSLLVL